MEDPFNSEGKEAFHRFWWSTMSESGNQLMDNAVCRTAPATLGLLNIDTASVMNWQTEFMVRCNASIMRSQVLTLHRTTTEVWSSQRPY